MAHLDTAYKLGALAAVDNFTAWLQNDDGNPTEYPKRRGSILKTANTPQSQLPTQAPSTTPTPAQPMPAGPPSSGAVGQPVTGSQAAPVTPAPAPTPPSPTPVASRGSSEGTAKISADRAVDQVMRKLGKSMSRRPLSRDVTKYEALKKKLRKQKSKKS